MKKLTWVGLLAVAGLMLVKGAAQAADVNVKIGVVDGPKIFAGYNKAKESQEELDNFGQKRQAEVLKKAEETDKKIKALQDKLASQGKVLKKEETEKITAEIEANKQDKLTLQRDFYQEIQTKKNDLFEVLVKEIQEAVVKTAKEKGYTFVISKEAVPYYPETADLSDQVIATLNKSAAKK